MVKLSMLVNLLGESSVLSSLFSGSFVRMLAFVLPIIVSIQLDNQLDAVFFPHPFSVIH